MRRIHASQIRVGMWIYDFILESRTRVTAVNRVRGRKPEETVIKVDSESLGGTRVTANYRRTSEIGLLNEHEIDEL